MADAQQTDLWTQPVDSYQFAWVLGYRKEWPPEHGHVEHSRLMQGDGLLCWIYDDHMELELYSREENTETTEYGSNVVQFDLPATVRDWFKRLCVVEHVWDDTPQDQAEFLSYYQEAVGEMQVEILKRFYRSLRWWRAAGEEEHP